MMIHNTDDAIYYGAPKRRRNGKRNFVIAAYSFPNIFCPGFYLGEFSVEKSKNVSADFLVACRKMEKEFKPKIW